MIPQITEIKDKFPKYATLSQATVTLNDMGDKTISTQIKIDGGITPDFSYDWEVEFQGERYIQPLREPQASKGNESICSILDLTFYHKTIYDLKRYYFPKMAEVGSGTASVDAYIADLNVNIEQFKVALQDVLDYYHEIGYLDEPITVKLYGEGEGIYAQEPQYVQIQYTHIWDVVQKIYEIFGVRWSIEGRTLRIGYPTEEVAHTFKYGFEGGLLKVERQVQSADIRNSLLGRGGEKNLPYRYFKDTDPENPSFQADPDWIPELANIYFAELRGKTFRDYVKGWKAKYYGGTPMSEPTEAYTKGYTDTTFNPIEYVEDKESIDKYGLLQGGLENQEDIYPTIQGVEVDGLGRIDEIVGAEQVVVDENTTTKAERLLYNIPMEWVNNNVNYANSYIGTYRTGPFQIPDGCMGSALESPQIKIYLSFSYDVATIIKSDDGREFERTNSTQHERREISGSVKAWLLGKNESTSEYDQDINIVNIPSDIEFECAVEVSDLVWLPTEYETDKIRYVHPKYGRINEYKIFTPKDLGNLSFSFDWNIDLTSIHGVILGNYEEGTIRKSKSITIDQGQDDSVMLLTDTFEVTDDGATNVDVPINIIVDKNGQGLYEFEKVIKAVNIDTNEIISTINIPKGKYYLRVSVNIRNNSTSSQTYKVELLPSYIYFPTDSEEFKPTFYIYVKNIWNTTRNEGESADAYTNRVWTPILGDREGNEAKVVFSTGWLAGHSDYEFVISDVEYAGDKGVQSEDGIPAEWKITLIKSDAELEATGLYIPSTKKQANVGDHFFFVGIDMPRQYVLWAEERLDQLKRDQLLETAHIKPKWVVQIDKVRLSQLQGNDSELLLDALKIGNSIFLADARFIAGVYEKLYLQSITYTWQQDTVILPDVEVVLSDKVTTVTNPVQQIQGEIDTLSKQVGSISNVQQIIRAIGDKLYLRKDGIKDLCKSPIQFLQPISSNDFERGVIGGKGWELRFDKNKSVLELDRLIVREEMQVNSLVSNQIISMGGKEITTAASISCNKVEDTGNSFRCYFSLQQGTVGNLFHINDIAYSQVFNPTNASVKYYRRVVVGVGQDYIDLSKTDFDGEGMPQVGDTIVQYGSTTDPNRQYVIIRDVIGGGYERMLSGLNSVSTSGEEYYFAGRLDNETPRWFVGNKAKQYIEYKDGELRIVANVTLGADTDLSGVEQFKKVQGDVTNLTDASVFTPADLVTLQTEYDKVIVEHNDIIYRCNEYGIDYQQDYEYLQPAEAYIDILARTIAKLEKGENVSSSEINENREAFYKALNEILPVLSDVIGAEIGSVNDKVDDLDYLKQVFPNALLNVNGASLAQLLGVKNTANNVVAGLYGGADEELNDSGFVDSTKGVLMFFAGAETLQDVANAATRIYQDGTLETNKIVANGGKLGAFEIDVNNNKQLKATEGNSSMQLGGRGLAFTTDGDAMEVLVRNTTGGNVVYPLTIRNKTQNSDSGINAGIAISVSGASGSDPMGHNVALLISEGDISMQSGMYRGLRPMTRIVDTSLTLSKYDNTIVCNNATPITLTLPNDPSIGQMYVVRGINKTGTNTITIQHNTQYILLNRGITDALVSSVTINTYSALELHYIGEINSKKYWIAAYQTKE